MNSSAMTGKLLAKQTWYPHEHRLVTEGIRAYTSVPMNVRSGLLGTAVFSRRTPVGFDQDQVSLLSDVARALAVAVTNALRVERDFLGNVMNKVNVDQHLPNEERDAIESGLRLSHGRISGPDGAAKRLGLPASTLEFRIKRLGIDKFSFR